MTVPPSAREIIAVVEDNADSALLANASLSSRFDVRSYTTGVDALAAFRRYTPAVVVLDIGLRGDMDGLQVLRTMRENPALSHVPAVAMTAYASDGMRERFLSLGFDGYVPKPLQAPEDLLDAVTALLGGRPPED